FFFSSRRRHTRFKCDWSSDVCSSDLIDLPACRGCHFPQLSDGTYAGHHPGDSAEAIRQLEMVLQRGIEYLLIPQTMRWWLDFYRSEERRVGKGGELGVRGESSRRSGC